ncbi:uncharacterized protein LOC125654324 [Ostrea edulis]|uniref:uncharacterized protein LOC125654324 n=1 Tax=Ostrea edulis TaxID=37623 RepID=UPI0024AF95FF|nr:uncharacterized protein LOC125654324 [Ostrea edulis]
MKMACFRVLPLAVLVSTLIPDVVEAAYCYYYSYNGYYSYYCSYSLYLPVGSIVGAVIGTLIGLATLIGLIVFFCCIRPRRMAARGTVLQPGVTMFATTTGVPTMQTGGGVVNTAAYPPGTTQAYPQYTYPPQNQAPSTGFQPPPNYS